MSPGLAVRVWAGVLLLQAQSLGRSRNRFDAFASVELRMWGIGVSAIAPGPTDTPIWAKSIGATDQLEKYVAPELVSLYETGLTVMRQAVARFARTASPIDRVVRAVVHALTAKRPKTHYFLGWPVRVCFKGMKMLPDRVRDWIVRKQIGLS